MRHNKFHIIDDAFCANQSSNLLGGFFASFWTFAAPQQN